MARSALPHRFPQVFSLRARNLGTTLLLAGVLLPACGSGKKADTPKADFAGPGRVAAVAAEPKKVEPLDEFCDSTPDDTQFEYPPLLKPATTEEKTGPRWINVWATWCGPCVRELPILAKLDEKMKQDKLDADLVYLSFDFDEDAIAKYKKKKPFTPDSLQITHKREITPWIKRLNLKGHTTLPIHMFVDADNNLRCVRNGNIEEDDYPTIRKFFQDVAKS